MCRIPREAIDPRKRIEMVSSTGLRPISDAGDRFLVSWNLVGAAHRAGVTLTQFRAFIHSSASEPFRSSITKRGSGTGRSTKDCMKALKAFVQITRSGGSVLAIQLDDNGLVDESSLMRI